MATKGLPNNEEFTIRYALCSMTPLAFLATPVGICVSITMGRSSSVLVTLMTSAGHIYIAIRQVAFLA